MNSFGQFNVPGSKFKVNALVGIGCHWRAKLVEEMKAISDCFSIGLGRLP